MIRELPPAQYLETHKEVAQALAEVCAGGIIGIDTETTGLARLKDRIVVWSFGNEASRYCSKEFTIDTLDVLRDFPDAQIVMHNASFDIHMLANSGVDPEFLWSRTHDSLVMSSLWNPDVSHELKDLGFKILGLPPRKYKSYNFAKTDLRTVVGKDFEELVEYASKDPWLTICIYKVIREDLENILVEDDGSPYYKKSLFDYYRNMDLKLAPILWRMERRGVRIDNDFMDAVKGPISKRLTELSCKFSGICKKVVNLRSPKQLGAMLFTTLGYPVISKTDSGAPSTDKEDIAVLLEQNPGDPLLLALQEFKEIDKAKGTSVEGIQKRMVRGRIHTSFNQHVAVTGRLSSSDPNLQNVPSKEKDKHKLHIRQAFIPDEGMTFIDADYSQVEIRVLAHLSQARTLIDPILSGQDIHSVTACNMFHIDYKDMVAAKKADKPTPEQVKLYNMRRLAKTLNFGVIYGVAAPRFQVTVRNEAGLELSLTEAEAYIDLWWKTHEDVRDFFGRAISFSKEHGYIPTYFGRRRKVFWPVSKYQFAAEGAASRIVYNTPVQGTAAEIVKLAMIKLEDDEELRDTGAVMLLQVHDELLFQVPKDNAERAKKRVVEIMQHPGIELSVPLLVEAGIADNWEEAK